MSPKTNSQRKLVTIFSAFLLVGILLLVLPVLPGCVTQEGEKPVWVKARSANIRSGPSTQNKVIASAKWNDRLLVIEEQGKWYKVKLPQGQIGWIYQPLCSSEKLYYRVETKPQETKPTFEDFIEHEKSHAKKIHELTYTKRKEIYIEYTEDPVWDYGWPQEKIHKYLNEKYMKKYRISKSDITMILMEGVQKGW